MGTIHEAYLQLKEEKLEGLEASTSAAAAASDAVSNSHLLSTYINTAFKDVLKYLKKIFLVLFFFNLYSQILFFSSADFVTENMESNTEIENDN